MEIKDDILKIIRKKNSDLPTLPLMINKIISVASDPCSTIDELETAISYDQAITSKLLKLSNSIYYAQTTKVETIKRAIMVIGFDEIMGIALGMEILSSFKKKGAKTSNLDALWKHSIGVAITSKELAKNGFPGLAGKLFIPGLLHDIGKVFFSVYFDQEYMQVQQFAIKNKKPLHQVENAILKFNHASLSGMLMKRWKFPESIETPCRFHHQPDSCPTEFKQHAFIIHVADYITQMAGIGGRGPKLEKIHEKALQKTQLNPPKMELIIDQLRKKKKEIELFFQATNHS
jgi:HD-like signal output (HDOD) protein